ncbi:DNA-binding response regulator [Cupriavidus pauculus]|jgi:DNA-binding NarL/FixJ family response regulator|uniref:DNA-binding response regulator n=1 Tax=Cupriavidus pauculus TaxID=82633 RepID=UPI001CC2A587|nr:DNA-binding response regulator [Cupriavidus pauculus]
MTTYLIASNEMMCRILARRMEGQDLPMPVLWRTPDWLADDTDDEWAASGHTVDIALVDCSGVDEDPRALLDLVRTRLAPRRWLVLSDALDAGLMFHAARLGASGCLAVPAPVELVCAAASLAWAGGQCFPRTALTLLREHNRQADPPPVLHSSIGSVHAGGPDGSTAMG